MMENKGTPLKGFERRPGENPGYIKKELKQAVAQTVNFRPGRGPGPGGPGRFGEVEKAQNAKDTAGRLLRYFSAAKKQLVGLIAAVVAVTLLSLAAPAMQGSAIDGIKAQDWPLLFRCAFLLLGIFIVNVGANLAQSLLAARLSQSIVRRMRHDLFRKIDNLPIPYLDSHSNGDIMSRMTNDVDNVSSVISSSISQMFSSVLTLIGALIMLLRYSWIMTLIAMITIPLTIIVSAVLTKAMRKYFVKRQQILGDLNGQIEEMVTGYKTVLAYGKEEMACERFAKTSEEFRKCGIRANVWGGIMGPCNNIINNLNYLIIAAFGGYFSIKGVLSIGDIQAILEYSRQFTQPINMLANQYAQILTAVAGAERVFMILDTPDEIDEGRTPLDLDTMKGNIEFKDITFGYTPEKTVLKNLNLSVKPGQKIAIVGATGSGKTTIVNLLMRFYDVNGGEILLDGVNINDIPKDDLRSAIGIVLQDTVLFSDTIASNIRYGRLEATDEELHSAAQVSKSSSFIERLPEGYETELTESGSNLSQGQRQLLAISRAVLADPKILILDEATSSVDTRTEMHIQQAMVALMKNRTSLIIAHRLSTIRDADVIVVIKNGVVAESGNHEELLAQKGEYFTLYKNQFAGFET